MNYEVILTNAAEKQLEKISKSNPRLGYKIQLFLDEKLTSDNDPCKLPNALKMQGFDDNRYRWKIADYRLIGIVNENATPIIINIIKISHRQEAYKK